MKLNFAISKHIASKGIQQAGTREQLPLQRRRGEQHCPLSPKQ